MKQIEINGKTYPCRVTMGAMLRFKRETGKDVSELSETDVADLLTLLWCCVASACAADHVSFGMGLMDFADALEPGKLTEFYTSMGEESPQPPLERGREESPQPPLERGSAEKKTE